MFQEERKLAGCSLMTQKSKKKRKSSVNKDTVNAAPVHEFIHLEVGIIGSY